MGVYIWIIAAIFFPTAGQGKIIFLFLYCFRRSEKGSHATQAGLELTEDELSNSTSQVLGFQSYNHHHSFDLKLPT